MSIDNVKDEFPELDKPIEEQIRDNIDRPERHNINPANRPVRNADPLSPRNLEHNKQADSINPTYYTEMAISPYEYVTRNKLNWEQSNIVKYISRYAEKNGKEDLLKVIKYTKMLITREYGND